MRNKLVLIFGFDTKSLFGNIKYSMEDRRAHLIIVGKVQGVFYRASAKDTAVALGLTGYVKNLPGGFVEIVAEGSPGKLNQFIDWCKAGPANAQVTDVKTTISPSIGEFDNFHIEY